MRKKRGESGECVYCGKIRLVTMDHVPPASLFPDPKPPLITVPSCYQCNNSASKDDEYFRLVVALREDVAGRADINGILPAVFRSVQKSNAAGLRGALGKWIQPKAAFSEGGIFLGMKPAIATDPVRLGKVAARIVAGLFFHETGKRLPNGYAAQACLREAFEEKVFLQGLPSVAKLMGQPEPKTIGTVFKYWVAFPIPEDPNRSVWFLLFYDQVFFLCQTLVREAAVVWERKWSIAAGVRRQS